MFRALGDFAFRRHWLVLAGTAVLLLASVASLLIGGRMSGATITGLEAGQADALIESVVGRRAENTVVFLFRSKTLAPNSPEFSRAMNAALEPLRGDAAISGVETPSELDPRLAATRVNEEGRTAYALITMAGDLKQALAEFPRVRQLVRSDELEVLATGQAAFQTDLNAQLEKDLLLAELVSFPLALIVLLLVFRTVVAALLPVVVGGLAVLGGIAVVLALSHVTDISQYTINVCSLIGLGVAIDYSLFTVARYREELAAGHDFREALVLAVDHAGRVVAFSALAVCSGLAGLLFFDGSYLMTMGVGGAIVVALAALFALTTLPALLAVLGKRIHALALPLPKLKSREGVWHGIAMAVMRRPVLVLVPTLGVLLLLASPFTRLRLAASDVRVLPAGLEAARGFQLLGEQFPDEAQTHFNVPVFFPSGTPFTPERIGALHDLSRRISELPGVRKVNSPVFGDPRLSREMYQGLFSNPPPQQAPLIEGAKQAFSKGSVVFLQGISAATPDSDAAREIVKAIRSNRTVGDGTLLVGGESALDVDNTSYLLSRAPRAVGFVVSATLLVLFLLLGSVLLPIKAVLMNFLSIGGSFGALVFIFQEGHGGLLHIEPHALEPALPVLLFCVLFGLSMDYEVLILTRMREAYERTGDNAQAVGEGLEKTAGLVTSAAAIMIAVFVAFGLAKVVLIQAVGVGMAIAVALDATLIRVLLVPATMRLFGKANWWGPRWVKKFKAGRPSVGPRTLLS
ncbi:MAG: MMPL family transporter [Archangium sp.]|nr:MMPL family transporter [Archangium sp.]MDP3572877.1 MMPL family transporter [Archangium sp.]